MGEPKGFVQDALLLQHKYNEIIYHLQVFNQSINKGLILLKDQAWLGRNFFSHGQPLQHFTRRKTLHLNQP